MIVWKQIHSVNNEKLDTQHKELFDIVNVLSVATRKNLNLSFITFAISKMINHFRDEEEYLEQMGYPYIEDHKSLHQEILELLEPYTNQKLSDEELTKTCMAFNNIVINHALGDDMEYAKWIKDNIKN